MKNKRRIEDPYDESFISSNLPFNGFLWLSHANRAICHQISSTYWLSFLWYVLIRVLERRIKFCWRFPTPPDWLSIWVANAEVLNSVPPSVSLLLFPLQLFVWKLNYWLRTLSQFLWTINFPRSSRVGTSRFFGKRKRKVKSSLYGAMEISDQDCFTLML